MSLKCPVTNKDCPYLQKLDSDVCPREHECEAVKNSYTRIGKRPPSPKKTLIIIFAIILLIVAAILSVFFFVLDGDLSQQTKKSESTQKTIISQTPSPIVAQTSIPSELPSVPLTSELAVKPVRIEFSNILAEITSVPLDESQKINVYPSATIISWYEGSSIPGESGNCIIFGHKHYSGLSGIFYSINKLKPGDIVTFILDNGSIIEQIVYDSIVYRDGFLDDDVLQLESETPRTVLISETGEVSVLTGDYKDLIVVFLH